MKKILVITVWLATASMAQARTIDGFGDYLNNEITLVENALAQPPAEGTPLEIVGGMRLTSFRLTLQALFGWKIPNFILLTVYPQIEFYFDRAPPSGL